MISHNGKQITLAKHPDTVDCTSSIWPSTWCGATDLLILKQSAFPKFEEISKWPYQQCKHLSFINTTCICQFYNLNQIHHLDMNILPQTLIFIWNFCDISQNVTWFIGMAPIITVDSCNQILHRQTLAYYY